MKRIACGLLVIVFVTALPAPQPAGAHQGHAHDAGVAKFGFKFRLSTMQALGVHMGLLLAEARGEATLTAERRMVHAEAAEALSVLVVDLFQQDTSGESRAKPEIWTDWAGFTKRIDAMTAATAKLSEAARGTDPAARIGALNAVGQTCTACHKAYRKRKR